MAILDYRGQPVEVFRLKEELAAASVGSVRQPWYDSVANFLEPERLAAILAGVDQGDAHDYLTLAEEMEERDLHYHSVLSTRKLAVSGLSMVVEAGSDDEQDVEAADLVRLALEGEQGRVLIADQLDALGKGYAVSEIMWDKSGKQWLPRCFEWRDPRHFRFDLQTGKELRLIDTADMANGVPLLPYKFVTHFPRIKTGLKVRGGLARLAVVAFMCKSYALKHWLAFAEVFGMPIRLGKYGVSATPEQKSQLLRAVTNIGTDAAAIVPDSMMIEFVEKKVGGEGEKIFEGLASYLDSQVSKGVLGQTMTTDNGSSLSQAQVHNDVREDIRNDDAQKLAATLVRDVVKPIVDLNFGQKVGRRYPAVRLSYEEPEDLKLLAEALPPFINLGMRVEESVIRDKFGLPEPEEGAEVLKPRAQPSFFGGQGAEDEELEQALQRSQLGDRQRTLALLSRKVLKGEALTNDERLFLAAAEPRGDLELDDLAQEELDGWRKVMGPLLDPILELADKADSYDAFKQGLKALAAKVNADDLIKSLALAMFKARALGDVRDEP